MVGVGTAAGVIGQAGLLAVLAGTTGLGAAGLLVGAAFGLSMNAVLARALMRGGANALGPANRVTLLRATLVGGVAALVTDALIHGAGTSAVVALASLALALDAVDGWVARRTATVSAVGALFDQEVDAFLILVLSIDAARSVGAWVLAIGAARYVFAAAGWFLPWLRAPLPPRYWRKSVAAVQGVVLTIAVAGVLPAAATTAAVAAALALLTESFGRDALWLVRRNAGSSRRIRTPGELTVARSS